jgi:hypothetical protein
MAKDRQNQTQNYEQQYTEQIKRCFETSSIIQENPNSKFPQRLSPIYPFSRYGNMWLIDFSSEGLGYKLHPVETAQNFFTQQLDAFSGDSLQVTLLNYFYGDNSVDNLVKAYAGLCLRCYVSEAILKACKKITHLFGGESFRYQDLLGLVLNDDGQNLIILDRERKKQLVVNHDAQTTEAAYQYFTVRVLQTFKPELMSLENWAYLQTKQHPELRKFLSEFGFKHFSDWALLNRTRHNQIKQLSTHDSNLVEIFHAVYRRDRLKQRQTAKQCPDPTNAQLQEMLALLLERGIAINNTTELMIALKYVAEQLRQYDIWSYRGSLEFQDLEIGEYSLKGDLLSKSMSKVDIEESELLEFLHFQFQLTFNQVIEQELQNHISKLKTSRKYAPLAGKCIPALQLYYEQGKSLREITEILKMSSWDQARRVLNPGELLAKVRQKTVQNLLERILSKAQKEDLIKIPLEPNSLKNLVEQIEVFVDDKVFQAASNEIQAGTNRLMTSPYAQIVRQKLNEMGEVIQHTF